jgi:glycosyltransferase involved in cell wall biosynthesis
MKDIQDLNVAIVHDWLVGGGAERVVLELHRMFPEAPIYTSYCSPEWRERLDGKVVTGFLQRWPFSALRKFVGILRIWWFTRLDFSGYDLVISSSGNGEAKGIRTPKGTKHICYCHSPTHYYWRHYDQYMRQPGFGVFDPLARLGLRLLVGPLRRWDLRAAQHPNYFIANSSHIQADIKKYYGRDATVIYPPIDIERFAAATPKTRHGFVTAGRQVPYKRTDIIIEACNKLQLPLTVIGRGPDHERLTKLAGPTITFLNNVSDAEMPELFASAQAFLFAAHEDFGVTPVEAMAAGTPVIAYKAGGALDYVTEGKTGLFFPEQTTESLMTTLQSFQPSNFNPQTIQHHAQTFSTTAFHQRMQEFIASTTSM